MKLTVNVLRAYIMSVYYIALDRYHPDWVDDCTDIQRLLREVETVNEAALKEVGDSWRLLHTLSDDNEPVFFDVTVNGNSLFIGVPAPTEWVFIGRLMTMRIGVAYAKSSRTGAELVRSRALRAAGANR